MTSQWSIACALAAALLFGASTPFAKSLVVDVSPTMLAGLLYAGSGVGLWVIRTIRDRGFNSPRLLKSEWLWFAGAILSGGIFAPALLMYGLTQTSAASASLLLNLEAVLTALLAWVVFKEHADRRIVIGMALIVAGGIVLGSAPTMSGSTPIGTIAVAAACLGWAIDNNLTRKVSASDAMFVAATKGFISGAVNIGIALAMGSTLPTPSQIAAAGSIGLAGYGVSLVLFVLALRGLGSARTGAYFSTAPFFGAAIAIVIFGETASTMFWVAACLMSLGVWLHLTEQHEHEHTHEPMRHTHGHVHDDHHQHAHDFVWDGEEPHVHEHLHQPLRHRHAHFPDIHHRHGHG